VDKVLSESLKELATVLNNNNVEYMLVGGIAVSYYAKPRPSTNMPPGIDYDVDIWYSATIGNFINLTIAIAQLHPELKEDLDKIIFDPQKVFLKFSIKNIHFDFVPELSAFSYKDFNKCFQSKTLAQVDGIPFLFIGKDDLILNKKTTGREKDKHDITNLNKNSYNGFSK
jgi:predicted nucleotidyltransferase